MATRITPYQPGRDDDDVLELRAEVWGKDHPHTSKAFYTWMFGDSGQAEGSGVVTRRDGKLVAFAAFVPRLVRYKQTTIKVAFGLDFMASPSLQGLSGLFAYKIVKAWFEQARLMSHDLAVCFPNEQSIRLLTSGKLNWQVIASPRLLVLPTLSIRFDESPVSHVPATFATAGGRILAAALLPFQPSGGVNDGIAPLDYMSDAKAVDALWQRAGHSKVHFERAANLLARRYGTHPIYSYRALGCRRDGLLTGYVITVKRKVMGVESDLIVDGLWDEDATTSRALLAAVVARARAERIGLVGAIALAGTDFYMALRRAGLLVVPTRFDPKPFHLAVHPLNSIGKKYMDGKDWHISWGDMDVV